MMVLEYAKDGNLREYLKINFNNINWELKLKNLWELSRKLMDIHELDIVHQDFHPGNILSSNFHDSNLQISDFGLSKLIGTNPNNSEKKNIFDPETHSYMMVLEYAKDGNLREYLKINFNNINWELKLKNLWELSRKLMDIHELDIVHQDFHPGNILSSNFHDSNLQISDFGLSKLIGTNPNNSEKKNIFVMGIPPYPDIPDLAMKICNGLRPKIPFHTPKLITRMILRYWDARVTHRPTFTELYNELYKYYKDYYYYFNEGRNKDSEIVIQIKKAEEFSANQESTNTTTTTSLNYQTHPQAIYTSRLLNFSKLPRNEENFERELEELGKRDTSCESNSHISSADSNNK
ncbi:hypothetical protein Glove_169g68 [Diversispora epigaea]|uniref:Protein kinase domain-containing protein n=1 Tax=Diversispora epigaea TaxID=1348612 RepID=A0A397IU82_9GLOM|nr:hypothetical protein Glove_169g68 [Diversispora epigaea]